MKKATLILVAAPSGAGKSTFVNRALSDFPVLQDTITCTTRQMRTGEKDGDPYYFLDKETFEKKISEGFFVEWARVHTNYYGTPRQQLDDIMSSGRVPIIDIDVQGAASLRKAYPHEAVTIFILPPSLEELKRRILNRDTRIPEDLEVRLINAQKEMQEAPHFDYQIVNDQFEESYGQFKKIIADLIKNH